MQMVQINNDESPYMWPGNLHQGNGKTIAFAEDEALVTNPLRKQAALDNLLDKLKETVKGNFIPAFLFLGGAAMVSHFEAIFQTQVMCSTCGHWSQNYREDDISKHSIGNVGNAFTLPHSRHDRRGSLTTDGEKDIPIHSRLSR